MPAVSTTVRMTSGQARQLRVLFRKCRQFALLGECTGLQQEIDDAWTFLANKSGADVEELAQADLQEVTTSPEAAPSPDPGEVFSSFEEQI